MAKLDDLTTVIRLACLTEARTNDEQRALLRVARSVDEDAQMLLPLSRLEDEVHQTRVLYDDDREVRLPARRGKTS